jgi:hypothetical protein
MELTAGDLGVMGIRRRKGRDELRVAGARARAKQSPRSSHCPTVPLLGSLLHGLAHGAGYFFRYRTVTKDGVSDWSQVVSVRLA